LTPSHTPTCDPRAELRQRGSLPNALVLLLADRLVLLDMTGRLRLGTLVTRRLRLLALMAGRLRLLTGMARRLRLLPLMAGRSRVLTDVTGRSRILTDMTRRRRLLALVARRGRILAHMTGRSGFLALGESGPRGDQQSERGSSKEGFSKHDVISLWVDRRSQATSACRTDRYRPARTLGNELTGTWS
jgi:hypothetical protein